MKYLLLLNFIFLISFFQAEVKTQNKKETSAKTESQTETTNQAKSKTPNKVTNQEKVKTQTKKISKKTTSKKSKKALSLEEISKSTALIISGTGDNAGIGSGFFITKSLLVTNSHVVKDAVVESGLKIVLIETQQGFKDVGFVFVEDRENDLAIIKTTKKIYKPLKLGKYNKVKMGDEIFVLGSPQGFVGTLSKGIVSAKRKWDNFQMLQITAPISQGSSGSPVLSKDLKVIGIAVALLKQGQNINFAVPVTYLKKLIRDNKKELTKISKLNLEKILKGNQAVISMENKKFDELETDFERGGVIIIQKGITNKPFIGIKSQRNKEMLKLNII